MASNFKISDLTALGREPADADVFIVNDASGVQQYTRSIAYADLLKNVSGGLSLQPVFVTFGVSWVGNASDYEAISSNDDLITPHPVKSVQMPPGTDRAIVINSYGSGIAASPLIRSGASTNAMAQFQYSVTLSNAIWRLAPASGGGLKMSMGTAYHIPAGYNYGVQDAYAARSDSSRPNVISFPPGALVSFELQLGLRRGKKCIPSIGGGRMLIFPYSSTDEIAPVIDAMIYAEAGDNVRYDDDDVFEQLTQAEIEQQTSQDIKNTVQYVIDRITQTLEYDTLLSTTFPDSTYPNPITGATSNVVTLLTDLRQAAYDIKYDVSTNIADYNTKLNLIIFGDEANSRPGLAGYVGFEFGFETTASDPYTKRL